MHKELTHKEWKWSTGEPYYKSARNERTEQKSDLNYDTRINAINQSLDDDPFLNNNDSDLINITNSVFSRNQNLSGTRREDIDFKMSDREMIAQRGVNPYLQTSYVNDVVAQDMFLKPINTTFERTKEEKDK